MQLSSLSHITTLEQLAKSSKYTHWLSPNLTVIEKAPFQGYLLDWMIEAIPLLRNAFIDLEKSREQLLRIRRKHVFPQDSRLVILYNRAVAKFNRYYPEKPIHPVCSTELGRLMRDCLRPKVTHFANDLLLQNEPCSDEALTAYLKRQFPLEYLQNEPRLSEVLKDIECKEEQRKSTFRTFEQLGGKAVLLTKLPHNERYEASIGISDQEIATVCHAGLVRSSTLRLILVGVKRLLGYPETNNRVRAQMGIENLSGHEDDEQMALEFSAAFDTVRLDHWAQEPCHDAWPEIRSRYQRRELKKSLNHTCFSHHAESSPPKLFIALSEIGFTLLERLIEENPQPASLKGVSVVMLPDGDWISHSRLPEPVFPLFLKMVLEESTKEACDRKKLSDLSPEERREVYFALANFGPMPANFAEKLKYYYEPITSRMHLYSFKGACNSMFQTEAFRVAYWKWSGIFQAVTAKN